MNTTTEKNADISRAILMLVNAGVSLPEAFDRVCGTGSYSRIVSDLYDDLRKS